MTWLKPGGYRKFVHKVSEYKVQSTAARTTLVPVKNSSIDQKTLLAVTNVAARPLIYSRCWRLDRSRWGGEGLGDTSSNLPNTKIDKSCNLWLNLPITAHLMASLPVTRGNQGQLPPESLLEHRQQVCPRSAGLITACVTIISPWAKLDQTVNQIKLRCACGSREAHSKKTPNVA